MMSTRSATPSLMEKGLKTMKPAGKRTKGGKIPFLLTPAHAKEEMKETASGKMKSGYAPKCAPKMKRGKK